MSIPTPKKRRPTARNLWTTLQNDPIVGLTFGIFAALTLLYLVPLLTADQMNFLTRRVGPLIFLSLVVAALGSQLPKIKAREDREFWNDLLRAYLCWWLAAALILFFPRIEDKPFAVDLVTSILYALYYVALLMAIERQPHRRHRWRPLDLERGLSWSTASAVVFGFFLYFPLIALWTNTEAYSSGIPDFCLYLTLDTFLCLRLGYLFFTVESPRWRLTYGLLAIATSTVLASDVAEALALITDQRLWHWDTTGNFLLYLPYVLMVVAARLRHHPFPWEPPPPASRIRLDENLPGPLGQTMIFTLLFPLIHFGCYELGILDQLSKPRREVLVLVWLPILGLIAMVQYRLLNKALRRLKEERQDSERALHRTQKELRLVQERQSTNEAFRASDARFSRAFQACPDVMAISRFEDGMVIEANEGCLRVLGYKPEDFVGHTSEELGLWVSREARADALARLREHGQVTVESAFRTQSGELKIGIFSARRIDIDGQSHLFSVTRDITETRQREDRLRHLAMIAEKVPAAFLAPDFPATDLLANKPKPEDG